ncbi:MAG: phage portal protein, partial [Planctomycetota bacterium]
MAFLKGLRNRLGWYSPAELNALIEAKSHPALGLLLDDARTRDTGKGIDPEGQDFEKYLKSSGLFGWVETCIDARAKAAAAVPLRLMRWNQGDPEPIEDHPLLDLLNDPNPEQGFYSFWYGLHQQLGYTGEAYISTDAPFSQQTDELWSLRADQMAPKPLKRGETIARRSGKEASALSHWIYRSDTGKDVR